MGGGQEALVGVGVGVHRQADLVEVVFAFGPRRRFPDLLHGRKQQADQDGDDGDNDKQFDEREGVTAPRNAERGAHWSFPWSSERRMRLQPEV